MSRYAISHLFDPYLHPRFTISVKVTVQRADAADEDAVAGLCKQALHEEGRLAVFFANVCAPLVLYILLSLTSNKAGVGPFALIEDLGSKEFMETMRINSLS